MKEYLFVYGTLRGKALGKFIGKGKTQDKFEMYDCGFPYIIPSENGFQIVGEVYLVDQETFKEIDYYEGVENGLYKKAKFKIILDNNETITAWLYFRSSPLEKSIKIEGSDWIKWKRKRNKS